MMMNSKNTKTTSLGKRILLNWAMTTCLAKFQVIEFNWKLKSSSFLNQTASVLYLNCEGNLQGMLFILYASEF
jgi:hypothetical protein